MRKLVVVLLSLFVVQNLFAQGNYTIKIKAKILENVLSICDDNKYGIYVNFYNASKLRVALRNIPVTPATSYEFTDSTTFSANSIPWNFEMWGVKSLGLRGICYVEDRYLLPINSCSDIGHFYAKGYNLIPHWLSEVEIWIYPK